MKVLMFSSDPKVREERSVVAQRMKKYEKALGELKIILLDRAQGRFWRFFKGYFEAERILTKERFDVISAQEPEHWFLAWLLSRKFDVPWQAQIHTDIFSPHFVKHSMFARIRVWLARFLIPRANCVRVVSERIKKTINRPDAVVLPIFSNFQSQTSNFNIRQKYPGYDFYILMVSRLTKEKNIPLAIGATKELVKKYPKILLVIVGNGPMVRSIEPGDNIKLEGWQNNLENYYQGADIFLLTSDYEGYGMAAVEALQHGLPVVMTDVGLAGDVVKNGENGLIAPVGDKIALAEALEKLYNDKELRARLSQNARGAKVQTEEEYLRLYIESLKTCAGNVKLK